MTCDYDMDDLDLDPRDWDTHEESCLGCGRYYQAPGTWSRDGIGRPEFVPEDAYCARCRETRDAKGIGKVQVLR